MKKKVFFYLFLFIGGWFLLSNEENKGYSFLSTNAKAAAPASSSQESSPANIKITADSIECDQKKQICTALGNAFIEKLDDPDKKTISADRIDMIFEKVPEGSRSTSKNTQEVSGQKPKEFHAYGKVVVVLKESIIRGNRAVYNPDTEIAEVFEDVSVTSGKNEVIGDYGHADLKSSEYKVRNSKGRVTAMVFQNSK